MARKRGPLRRLIPWLLLLLLGLCVTFFVRTATEDASVVQTAHELRLGDRENDVEPDPFGAIELLLALLERDPDHFAAHEEIARAYQQIRAFEKTIEHLEQALANAPDEPKRLRTLRQLITAHTAVGEYEEATVYGERIIELQPDDLLRKLQLGDTHYRGSVAAQRELVSRYLGNYRTQEDVELEELIEAYVTSRRPDLEATELASRLVVDSQRRTHAAELMLAARDRFALARQSIAPLYYGLEGFDLSIATSYVSLLVRSGRYYEAMLEIRTALREPSAQISGARRVLLERMAECSTAVGDWAGAADAHEEIIESMLADHLPRIPPMMVAALYEARIRAGQWDWIERAAPEDVERFYNDVYIQYAIAAAQTARGQWKKAFETILEPYTTIALGRELTMPSSVRMHPQRRKDVVQLALELFERKGDRRTHDALNYLVTSFPDDTSLRLALVDAELDANNLEAAAIEAQRLLTDDRRDRGDFDRWLSISDRLSEQRFGAGLAERAADKIAGAKRFREQLRTMRRERERITGDRVVQHVGPRAAVDLSTPDDPALWFTTIEALLEEGDAVEARLQLRKLASEFPEVNEFRFRLGRLLVRDGLLEAALEEFLVLLDKLPQDSEVLDLAMRTMRALDREEEAARLVSELVLADPLGLGAVRYGHELLDKGRPAEAQRLVERLVRWTDIASLDISMLSARAHLAMGDHEAAESILTALINQHPDSVDVITLALELGLEADKGGLRATAIAALDRVAAELFPEQMREIADLLVAAGEHERLLDVIDERIRYLPVAKSTLRTLAEAAKALGRLDETHELLTHMDEVDGYAPLDRFLLLSMQGDTQDAAHRVRLESSHTVLGDLSGLCLTVADALAGREVLLDADPGGRVADLAAPLELDEVALDLLDAALRVAPSLEDLDEVLPPEVVTAPREVYGSAGPDVERLVALGRDEVLEARTVWRMLLHMILTGDRSFWGRERTFLAESLRERVPDLAFPTRMLARDRLRAGDAEAALAMLFPLISADEPDPEALRMFTVAARLMGHPEWGVAVTAELREQSDEALLLIADLMRGEGLHGIAQGLYEDLLERAPDHPRALEGIVQVTRARRDDDAMIQAVRRSIEVHPDDAELMRTCANAIALVRAPGENVVHLLATLFERDPDNNLLGEALARAQRDDPEAMRATLETMVERARDAPLAGEDPEDARTRVGNLTRAARTARDAGFFDLAEAFNDVALLIDPAGIDQYRELALVARERGDARTMRRYLEAVNVLEPSDRESAMTLARLLFDEFGEPVEGAAVIRRSFPTGATPAEALVILAGELFLKGRPEAAIQIFYRIQDAPTIPEMVFLEIGQIAYASGEDELARQLFDHVLDNAPPSHPRLPRLRYLREKHLDDRSLLKRAQQARDDSAAALAAGTETAAAPGELPRAAAKTSR